MKASILRTLCVEIYKSVDSLNSTFIYNILRLRVTERAVSSQYRLNLGIPKVI